VLLKWAVAVFDDLRRGVREIEFLTDPTGGEVRVGSAEMMNAGLLPSVIDRLSRQYPRLVFTVVQAPTIPAQYRDLRERCVDFVFGRMMAPIETEDDLDVEILFEDPLIVVASAGNKWLRRRKIEPAELIDERWCLMPDDTGVGPFLTQAFRAHGLGVP